MKKIKFLLLTIFLLIIGIIKVNAELVTDFSNISYEIINESETDHSWPELKINGVEFYFGEYEYQYYLYFSHTKEVPTIDEISYDDENIVGIYSATNVDNKISLVKYLAEAGDLYVTIYQYQNSSTTYEQATEPTKLERPKMLPLEYRIQGVFAYDGYVILNKEPVGVDRKINFKIGKLTDNTLLSNIKNGTSNAMENLLEFSKKDAGLKSGQIIDGLGDTSIVAANDLVDGNYYYIYLSYDNANGKYQDVEDIWLTQAKVYGDGKWYLFSRDSEDFVWNIQTSLWDKFVENYKASDNLKLISDAEINISYTSSNMVVTIELEDEKYETEFKYNNGIITYAELENSSDNQRFIDSILVETALLEFAKLHNYDQEKFIQFVESRNDFLLDKDGIEFINKLYVIEESSDNTNSRVSFTNWQSLKLDLINGLKTFNTNNTTNNVDTPIENPETGVLVGICVILLTGIVGGIILIAYKKINNKNKIIKI